VPQLVSRLQGCFTCKEIHADGDLTGELLQMSNGGDLHRTLTSTTSLSMAPAKKTKTRQRQRRQKAKEPLHILGIPYIRLRDDAAHVHESQITDVGRGHHGCRSCGLQIHQAYTPNAHTIKMDMTRLDMAILEKFGNDHTLEEELRKLYGLRAFSRTFKGEEGREKRGDEK
jgi:hypothetical protein